MCNPICIYSKNNYCTYKQESVNQVILELEENDQVYENIDAVRIHVRSKLLHEWVRKMDYVIFIELGYNNFALNIIFFKYKTVYRI